MKKENTVTVTYPKEKPEHGSLRLLVETMEAKCTPEQKLTIKEIGHTIQETGLSLPDAALLSFTDIDTVNAWQDEIPEIKTYFKLKLIQYKSALLRIINVEAKEKGDVKQATWLLENHFATEYNPQVKKEMEKLRNRNDDDIVAVAVAFVRDNANTTPVNDKQSFEEAKHIEHSDVNEILS